MKKSILHSFVFKALLLVVITVLAYSCIAMQININARKKENDSLGLKLIKQKKENDEQAAILQSNDLDFAEKIARDKLGYGSVGEKIYSVIGE